MKRKPIEMYLRHKTVKITITTEDGEVMDQFHVSHYRTETDHDDEENVGSRTANGLLAQRIERYVWEPICAECRGPITNREQVTTANDGALFHSRCWESK